jgi:drug/metabolite transporter (DMT)-like permease
MGVLFGNNQGGMLIFAAKMTPQKTAFLRQHIAVVLFGFTGILGVLISLDGFSLTWWRMLFTVMSFLAWPGLVKRALALPRRDLFRLMGIGVLVALHWVTFFGSISMTNASVAVAVLPCIALFTAVLEPLITGSRFKWYEVALAVTVVPGVILIKHATEFPIDGILVAVLSALFSALFSVFNKVMVAKHDAVVMTFVELTSGWLFLSLCLPFVLGLMPGLKFAPNGMDLAYLGILALGCTTLAYVLSLRSLEQLSTFTVTLILNLEPVYTIILAWLLLAENAVLGWGFYAGAAIIIGSVSLHPLLRGWLDKKPEAEPTTPN